MGLGIAAAIGGSVLGVFGAGATFLAGTLGTVISTAIGGAIIGATIGGLSSAVMGGDIGEGILFGALGGAVLGGVGAAFAGEGAMLGVVAGEAGAGGIMAGMEAAEVAVSMGTGVSMAGVTTGAFGMKDAIGYALDYKAGEEATEAAEELSEQRMEIAREQMASSERIAGMRTGGGGTQAALQAETARRGQDIQYKMSAEQLAEARRKDIADRERAKVSLETRRSALRKAKAGVQAGPMVEQEVSEIDRGLMQSATAIEEEKRGLMAGGS